MTSFFFNFKFPTQKVNTFFINEKSLYRIGNLYVVLLFICSLVRGMCIRCQIGTLVQNSKFVNLTWFVHQTKALEYTCEPIPKKCHFSEEEKARSVSVTNYLTFSKLWYYYALVSCWRVHSKFTNDYFFDYFLYWDTFHPFWDFWNEKNSKIVCDRATSAGRSFWLNKCPRRPADVKLWLLSP